jgi:hypothetical protein
MKFIFKNIFSKVNLVQLESFINEKYSPTQPKLNKTSSENLQARKNTGGSEKQKLLRI